MPAQPTFDRSQLEAFWMPFTANRQFKANPRLLARAEGMHYWTPEGRQILDGTAGLWCVNAGHGRREIVEAVRRQAAEMDFAPTFQMGHPIAFELATELVALTPGGLDHVFFTNSGSEAVDTALKIALAYHRARGEGTRTRFIGRERGYHGVRLRRHLRGRHRSTTASSSARCCRASITCRTRTTSRTTPSRAASPSTARTSPTSSSASSRCTTRATSPR